MFNKLAEQGYVAIPLKARTKAPGTDMLNWTQWCKEMPPQDLLDKWDALYNKGLINIGVTCGPASGIIVLDIDTDDKKFISKCPTSPLVKRGKKGESRFFKYNPKIKTKHESGIDILSDGSQTVIPPSIHPDTNQPYVWLSPDDLMSIKPCELPELDISFLKELAPMARLLGPVKEGRNNKLKDMVCSMRCRGEDERTIVKEIYDWDIMYNKPRLFTDSTEGFKSSSEDEAIRNAWAFVTSVTASMIKSGIAYFDEHKISVQINEDEEQKLVEKFKPKNYPEPTGLLKDIRDLILQYSERDMPNIALGGAVALLGYIYSNRYRCNNTWTNVYVLNLAPTGAGKSFPQTIIGQILEVELGIKLVGYGSYQSSAAFLKNLVSKRERLDVIDEISSLFAQMKSGGLWQTGILEEMCKVWSSSYTKFNAPEYAEKEDLSSCFNPCINILGSSTLEGIKANMTKLMVTKGLFPRFLIFSHDNYGEFKNEYFDEQLFKKICSEISSIIKTPKQSRDIPGIDIVQGPVHDPVNLAPTESDAIDLLNSIREDFAKRIENADGLSSLKDMLTRGKEQTIKLATIHAAANKRKITQADLIWGRNVFDTNLHNSSAFIDESAVDTDWEKDVNQLLNLFKSKGFITEAIISNRIQRLQPQRIKTLLTYLMTSEKIVSTSKEIRGRKAHGWSLAKI